MRIRHPVSHGAAKIVRMQNSSCDSIVRLWLPGQPETPAFHVRVPTPGCVALDADACPGSGPSSPLTILLRRSPSPAGMPARQPWMFPSRGITNALRQLRSSLIGPLRRPGLIGVDLADYESALSLGGRIRFERASSRDAKTCAMHLSQAFTCVPAALCVHLRLPEGTTIGEIDHALGVIDAALSSGTREVFCVFAANLERRRNVAATALAIDGSVHA